MNNNTKEYANRRMIRMKTDINVFFICSISFVMYFTSFSVILTRSTSSFISVHLDELLTLESDIGLNMFQLLIEIIRDDR